MVALPARLIEIGNTTDQPHLTISNRLLLGERYVTLSHCWGSGQYLKLTTATNDRLRAGFDITLLPPTFRDAVRIARRLGVRYLWIVPLCILLDSPSDWDKETLAMADIYRGAYCNIAATGATDGNVGLSYDGNVHFVERSFVQVQWPDSSLEKFRAKPKRRD